MDSDSSQNAPDWFEEILKSSQNFTPTDRTCDNIAVLMKKRYRRHPKSAEVRSMNDCLETLTNNITEFNLKKNVHKSREGSARYGRRSVMNSLSAGNSPQRSSSNYGITENLHQIDHSQQFFNKELSLEESWSSLSFFDKKHKGMLSQKQDNESPAVESAEFCDDEQDIKEQTRKPSKSSDMFSSDFIIPELPKGQLMVINIKSTWGDKHYLGLNGIEIFSSLGEPVNVLKIWAEPPDINILPEYDKDPRIVKNLLDGVNKTHDDMHLWLAPFTQGTDHFIYLKFETSINCAMIRIWNYNKSRIHSYRGVRDVEITLDKALIFYGEIARASGGILGGTESFGDTILFTTDENILELISQFDDSFSNLCEHASEDLTMPFQRPVTADARDGMFQDERPFTCAHRITDIQSERMLQHSVSTHILEIHLLENWGHPALIGLSGIEIHDESGELINIHCNELECNIPSPDIYRLIDGINVTTDDSHMWNTGFLNGRAVVFKITFHESKSITSIHLWNYNASPDLVYCGVKIISVYLDGQLVPIGYDGLVAVRRAPGNCHFNFVQEINLVDSFKTHSQELLLKTNQADDSYRNSLVPLKNSLETRDHLLLLPCNVNGKCANVSQHQTTHSPSDNDEESDEGFVQSIHPSVSCLTSKNMKGALTNDENYEAPDMPQGFVFQLLILSTWGDMYYVGLNGLEIYDEEGKKIILSESNIGAFPDSVNVLEGVNSDVRTPEKLIDGINDTFDGRHMWLAPILPNQLNRVYIVFDYPVKVSMIKLWNYAKTPSRGVKEFGVLVDDLLVYNGELDQASNSPFTSHVPYRTVLFTNDKNILMQEQNTQVRHSSYGNHVRLLNDQKRVTSGGSSCYSADPMLRPTTSLLSKSKDFKV